MALNLFAASTQWSTRPDDERFWTLSDAYRATKDYADNARVAAGIPYSTLRTEAKDGEIVLVGSKDIPARLSHWAFGQLASRVGAPAGYLRQLPATLAAQNLNHGLKSAGSDEADILLHTNGGWLTRAFTSPVYNRIWNWEVIERALELEAGGWRTPPARPARAGQAGSRPATAYDVLQQTSGGGGLSVNVGDIIAPAGIYASDHDCFLFLVNEQNRVQDGTPDGLSRGVFITNSEVGAASLRVTRFYYRHVCGNHIVWDASNVVEVRLRHVGDRVDERFSDAIEAQVRWIDEGSREDEQKIARAKTFRLGESKEDVLDAVFGKRSVGLSRAAIGTGYDSVLPEIDGDPRSAWGLAQGLTRASQQVAYSDERDRLDRAAGKVVELAF